MVVASAPIPVAEAATTWAPVIMARAEVTLMLKGRELPRMGYTSMAARAVYSPASTGSPAMTA
jgi:hypothetical protein